MACKPIAAIRLANAVPSGGRSFPPLAPSHSPAGSPHATAPHGI